MPNDDLAARAARHWPIAPSGESIELCARCEEIWPCDAYALAAAWQQAEQQAQAAEARVAALEATLRELDSLAVEAQRVVARKTEQIAKAALAGEEGRDESD